MSRLNYLKGKPRGEIRASPLERVLSRVASDTGTECWIFTGALNEAGYGIVGLGRRGQPNDRAHRVVYRFLVGDTPAGMFVCHRCDVPACCNPNHLFLGTPKENSMDSVKKGRSSPPPRNKHLIGSAHYAAKLTETQVLDMRQRRRDGATLAELAHLFGVNGSTVWGIVSRQRWRHI